MSVLVSTAYMEEAQAFDWLAAMDAGKHPGGGTPRRADGPNAALTTWTPPSSRSCRRPSAAATARSSIPPRRPPSGRARHRGRRRSPSASAPSPRWTTSASRIERGEIFGFLGSNGCGKTTTMKMLTGLLARHRGPRPGCSGAQWIRATWTTRRRVGYMSQAFSLYGELTVRQNLELHARLFRAASGHARRAHRRAASSDSTGGRTPTSWPRRCPSASASGCRWRWRWCTSPRS